MEPKTIKFGKIEAVIVAEYDKAICHNTTGINCSKIDFKPDEGFKMTEIKFGDIVYEFKILKSGSCIFKLKEGSTDFYVTLYPQFFCQYNEKAIVKIEDVKKFAKIADDALTKRNKLAKQVDTSFSVMTSSIKKKLGTF